MKRSTASPLDGFKGLKIWHWGCVVPDLEASVADWTRLGAIARTPTCRLQGASFDAQRQRIVAETVDVAFLKLAHGQGVVELIQPVDATMDGPQSRLMKSRPGLTHVAAWCDNLPETARSLMRQGASIVTMALPRHYLEGGPAALDAGSLLTDAAACYLRLPGGQLVELNPAANHASLPRLWGDAILDIVARPEAGIASSNAFGS